MSVVGFDLGNENSIVAVAKRASIDTVQNEVGKRKTASIVAFAGKERLLGDAAVNQMHTNAKNSLKNFKRLMGRKFKDPDIAKELPFLPYQIGEGPDGKVVFKVQYDDKKQDFLGEQIYGAMLTKLKEVAESGLGTRVVDCCISVPPYFNDVQRRAVLDSAHIAGLNVLRLINETTAIALYYGIMRDRDFDDKEVRNVVFVDMGATSYDVALVQFTKGKLQVLGTASDPHLGGRNFDQVLVDYWVKVIKEKYKMDVSTEPKAMMKLRAECEKVKINLSAGPRSRFGVEYIMNERDVSGMMERTEFEALIAEQLLDRLFPPLQKIFESEGAKKYGVTRENIFAYEIVGGGLRIPAIKKALSDFFKKQPSQTCDSDESIARGCALQCAMLSPSFKVRDYDVHDIQPYPIELFWGPVSKDKPMEVESSTALFPENNPMPSVKLVSFKDRVSPFQLEAKYADVKALPLTADPLIGRFIVSGMTPPPEGQPVPKIKVRVKLDLNSLLSVPSAQVIEEIKEEPAAEAAKDGEKMDVSDDASKPEDKPKEGEGDKDKDKDKEKDKEKEKAKKKVRKTDLKVESFLTGGCDPPTLAALFEKEAQMANQDRIISETNNARNSLESYFLEMRNRVEDVQDLGRYVTDADKAVFTDALNKAEEWLYEGDGFEAQKSEYVRYLGDLQKMGDPIMMRKREAEGRAEAVAQLKSTINRVTQWAATKEEKYAHIGEAERKKVVDKATETDKWLTDLLIKQDRVPLHQNPVVTVKQIEDQAKALQDFATPIMNTPKPAPPKEEPKKEEAKKGDAKQDGQPQEADKDKDKAQEAPQSDNKAQDGAEKAPAGENASNSSPKAEEPKPKKAKGAKAPKKKKDAAK